MKNTMEIDGYKAAGATTMCRTAESLQVQRKNAGLKKYAGTPQLCSTIASPMRAEGSMARLVAKPYRRRLR